MKHANAKAYLEKHIALIRRVTFSRSLRMLPLQEKIGSIEALAVIIDSVPELISVTDQHLLAFLSELLKMASIAGKSFYCFSGIKNCHSSATISLTSSEHPSVLLQQPIVRRRNDRPKFCKFGGG